MPEDGNIGLPMSREEYQADRAQNIGFTNAVYAELRGKPVTAPTRSYPLQR